MQYFFLSVSLYLSFASIFAFKNSRYNSHHTVRAIRAPTKGYLIGDMTTLSAHEGDNQQEIPRNTDGWKAKLSPNQFAVLRQKATEPSGFSEGTPGQLEYELKKTTGTKYPKEGVYQCVGCGADLYTANSKFDSGCGWPAYFEGIPNAIKEVPDADGRRIEIVCNNCYSHLGHVFKGEGFSTPTNERHCVNGICLRYKPLR